MGAMSAAIRSPATLISGALLLLLATTIGGTQGYQLFGIVGAMAGAPLGAGVAAAFFFKILLPWRARRLIPELRTHRSGRRRARADGRRVQAARNAAERSNLRQEFFVEVRSPRESFTASAPANSGGFAHSVTGPARIVGAGSGQSNSPNVRADVGVTPWLPPCEPRVSTRLPPTVHDEVRNPQRDAERERERQSSRDLHCSAPPSAANFKCKPWSWLRARLGRLSRFNTPHALSTPPGRRESTSLSQWRIRIESVRRALSSASPCNSDESSESGTNGRRPRTPAGRSLAYHRRMRIPN